MKWCASVRKGFYFQCQQCGKCCSNDTEGYVFIFKEDLTKIATFLHFGLKELAEQYLSIIHYYFNIWNASLDDIEFKKTMPTLVLNYHEKQDCVFLHPQQDPESGTTKKMCQIYGARPIQCELYPFWSMIMTNELNYKSNQGHCAGFVKNHGDAPYYSLEEIERRVKIERQAERDYYLQMRAQDFDIFAVYPFLREINRFQTMKLQPA